MKLKNVISLILGVILLAFVFSGIGQNSERNEEQSRAEVKEVLEFTEFTQTLELLVLDGEFEGETIRIENDEEYSNFRRIFEPGDKVMVIYNPDQEISYITDFLRSPQLVILFVLFLIVAILVTGSQGLGALIGMGLSFVVIFKFILPQILNGQSPILMAILGAVMIIPLTFYPSHGFNKKTNIAILSTFFTLLIAGIIAAFFADFAHLTGLASEEANFLKLETAERIDFQGLILAGILISILGVLDDITISQASVVQQLKLAKKNIKFSELFARAMAVGSDHIASLVNTLILVYTGAAMPLMLLFLDHDSGFMTIINLEFISEEIVRTLIGSIALILAVPITTVLASLVNTKNVKVEHHHH